MTEQERCEAMYDEIVDLKNEIKHKDDLINRQKAEIERLQSHIKEGIDLAKQIPEMMELVKAEAYKEFAERLKEDYEWFSKEIDNLLKELVGDDNEG